MTGADFGVKYDQRVGERFLGTAGALGALPGLGVLRVLADPSTVAGAYRGERQTATLRSHDPTVLGLEPKFVRCAASPLPAPVTVFTSAAVPASHRRLSVAP